MPMVVYTEDELIEATDTAITDALKEFIAEFRSRVAEIAPIGSEWMDEDFDAMKKMWALTIRRHSTEPVEEWADRMAHSIASSIQAAEYSAFLEGKRLTQDLLDETSRSDLPKSPKTAQRYAA